MLATVADGARNQPDKSDVEWLLGSNENLWKLTGWSPSHRFSEGIAKTIEWFRLPENLSRYKSDVYNI